MTTTDRPLLTGRQADILAFLVSYHATHGYSPSVRDIGTAVGLNSTSSVQHQLNILEARGYVKRGSFNRSRSISVIASFPFCPTCGRVA